MTAHGTSGADQLAERWNRVFRVLAATPRRHLILTLLDSGAPEWVSLPAAAMSSHYDATPEELTVELVHHHLPLLAEHDYVAWREDPLSAARGPNFQEIGGVLEVGLARPCDFPDSLREGCEVFEVA